MPFAAVDHTATRPQRRRNIAVGDCVGQVPRWHVASAAQVRRNLIDTKPFAGAVSGEQAAGNTDEAIHIVAQVIAEQTAGLVIESEPDVGELLVNPCARLSLIYVGLCDGYAQSFQRLIQLLGQTRAAFVQRRAPTPDQDQLGCVEGIVQVSDKRLDRVTSGKARQMVTEDDTPIGQHGRRLGCVDKRRDAVSVVDVIVRLCQFCQRKVCRFVTQCRLDGVSDRLVEQYRIGTAEHTHDGHQISPVSSQRSGSLRLTSSLTASIVRLVACTAFEATSLTPRDTMVALKP